MAYSTEDDILEVLPQERLIQLTDDVSPVDTIDSAIVTAMIDKADNQINSYLRGKATTIPIDPVPPRVKDWSVTLAVFKLYGRRINLTIPDTLREDKDAVIDELKEIRDGKALIDDAESPSNTASFYQSNGKDFGELFDTNSEGTGCLDQYYNGPAPTTNRNRSS